MHSFVPFTVLLVACSSGNSSDAVPSASLASAMSPSASASKESRPGPNTSGVPLPDHLFLGATASHACFVSERRNLFCWGRNDEGQLGSGSGGPPLTVPVQWKLAAPVRAAALGEKHTCALLEDESVRCVGVDASGPRHAGDAIAGLSDVQSIVAGGDFTCARSRDDSVRCWGRVPGRPGPERDAKLVAGLAATELTASTGTLCGATRAGIVCLGDNVGGTTLIGGPPTFAAPTPVPYATGLRGLAVSDLGLCGLVADKAQCWSDDVDRLGFQMWESDDLALGADGLVCVRRSTDLVCQRLPHGGWLGWRTDGAFREMGVGRGFVCALPKEKHVAASCWGDNMWGELGISPPTARLAATKIPALQGTTRIAAGSTSLCGLMPDKKIRCLGQNGKTDEHWSPNGSIETPLGDDAANAITRADDMSIGGGIRCAFTDGLPTCWGDNRSNQIITVNPGIIDQPSTFASLGKLKRLVFGPSHACSIGADDKIRCWGGEGKDRKAPAEVSGLEGALDVAVGGDRGCALMKDGTVSCFLLRGEHALEPRKIAGAKGFTSIVAGGRHHCGITAQHEVSCFGANDLGQLGRPLDAKDGGRSAVVSKLDHVKQVTLGETFTCALLDSGTVRCFGSASEGELARDDKQPTSEPVTIAGLSGVAQIAASAHAVSARLEDGSVVAWGGRAFFAKVGKDREGSETARPISTKDLTEESP